MLKTDAVSAVKVKNIIRRWYEFRDTKELTNDEIIAELHSMNRHKAEGSLDCFYEPLYYKLEGIIEA